MGLAGKVKCFSIGLGAAAMLYACSPSQEAPFFRGMPNPDYHSHYSPALQKVTFDDVLNAYKDREKGQVLVDNLAQEVYGNRAYEHVEQYVYDPDYSLSNEFNAKTEDDLAADPDFFPYVKRKLAQPEFLEGVVKEMLPWREFSSVSESEKSSRIRQLLAHDEGIKLYISSSSREAKDLFNRRNHNTLGRAICTTQFPGRAAKSNIYLHSDNFEYGDMNSGGRLILSIDGNDFYLMLRFKPTEESLKGVIVHEGTHAQDYHTGMRFSNEFTVNKQDFPIFSGNDLSALTESRASIAELGYLRQFNSGQGNFHSSYMSQIFFMSKETKGWKDNLKSPSKTRIEKMAKELQLQEVINCEAEIDSAIAAVNRRVKDISIAMENSQAAHKQKK